MKKLILLLTAFIGLSATAQKIGTVNSQEVLLTLPEVKIMQGRLQAKNDELTKQLEGMYKTYEEKVGDYQKNEKTMSASIKDLKAQEIKDLEGRIQKFQQSAQQEIQELERTLTAPLLEKTKKAIQDVSKELGYSHVFDIVTGALLVWPDTNDITKQVKIKLGIDPNAKPIAAPNNQNNEGMPVKR